RSARPPDCAQPISAAIDWLAPAPDTPVPPRGGRMGLPEPPALGAAALPKGTFTGAAVVVTGGGTGLGKAIAVEFARLGAALAILSRGAEHRAAGVAAVEALGARPL